MSSPTLWKPRQFNYDLTARTRKAPVPLNSGDFHPLKPIVVTGASSLKSTKSSNKASSPEDDKPKNVAEEFIDPLSALSMVDPLSAMAMDPSSTNKKSSQKKDDVKVHSEYGNDFEPWSSRKLRILTKYTTNNQLTTTMTSMSKGESRPGVRRYQAGSNISDKLKDRLGQLDDFEEGGFIEMQNVSQEEFVEKMHQLNKTLIESWNTNQKVKSLKIAIQCAKLLGDMSVIQFYPSKFVLVTDLLETFGSLVFERIFSLCKGMSKDNIVPGNVPDSAREICVNWMLKVASIRELLPRLFVEASIIHCNKFLENGELKNTLNQLTRMACGIGNPLVAVYFRTFLCRVGVSHAPEFKGYVKVIFYDFLLTYKQILTNTVQNQMAAQKLDMSVYLDHYIPALEWILSALAYKAREATLTEVLERCKKSGNSLMLLNCCIAAFDPSYVSGKALALCELINQHKDDIFPRDHVFITLGHKVIAVDPPKEDCLTLLNEVWKVLMKIHDPKRYINCAEVWLEFATKNFTKKEVGTILGDIMKHMMPDREFEKHYAKLTAVVSNILKYMKDFAEVFSMDKFLPFLDMFQNESKKVEVCRMIATAFNSDGNSTSDPIVINGLMYVCKVIHDSINALSLDDDRKLAASIISSVVLKISFGKDFEQQLSFYVECRATFYGLDGVLVTLTHAVNSLSAKVTKIVKGNHTRKTASFVRACTAYTFITIPSLSDVHSRLLLYMESGQVALISQCITQADAMYKSAVSMIMDLLSRPEKKAVWSQQMLLNFVSSFLSNLLLVPDNPDQGVLYLLRGFLNVVSRTEISTPVHVRCLIYIKVLSILTAFSQNQYLYHVDRVDSNDNLYNSDPKFLLEITKISGTVLDEILAYLSSNVSPQESKQQATCAMQLFDVILAHGDLSVQQMQNLAVTAWKYATKDGGTDTKTMVAIIDYMKKKGGVYRQISTALPMQSAA